MGAFAPESNTPLEKICNISQLLQDLLFTYRKEMADPEGACVLSPIYARLIRCGPVVCSFVHVRT